MTVADFYASARGAVAARLLRERLGEFWPPGDARGGSLLGFGYCAPYLRLWRETALRCVMVTPPRVGAVRWPAGAANLSCPAEEDALPFADLSFDRVLVVHGLETADHARRLLRELWRVLKDDGRLVVVAPNRHGLWAHMESNPFGQGQPYTQSQIGRLLAESMFRVERRETVLHMPPLQQRMVLRSARLFERAGHRLVPGFAGLTISDAVKDVYAALPAVPAPRRKIILAEAA
jgi:SAM-dependent methyltransferase